VKEAAGRDKINFQKLEHLIHDYNNCAAKLPKGEQLIEGLDASKAAMEAAKQVVKENDPSIEALNAVSNRLDSVPVNLGIEETEIRCQLWRLKVKGLLSGKFRVQFQVINSWYNEGRKLDQNVSELEKLVAQGGRVKEQFSECDTLEELEKAIAEESELPFDLT